MASRSYALSGRGGSSQGLRIQPEAIVGRDWTTGQLLFSVPLRGAEAAHFGAPTVDLHRADLLGILANSGVEIHLHPDSRCTAVSCSGREAVITLNDQSQESFDLVVGCDGIRSTVRQALHGRDTPLFTGNMCWRALISTAGLPKGLIEPKVTLWTGKGGHIVTFFIRSDLINLVAVRETNAWMGKSWSTEGQAADLLVAYPDIHENLRALLEQTERCFKWGLFDRDPLPTWSKQRATLLGDAAHPMLPFLGQGAAMAMEDAFVLARELARSPDDISTALRFYEAERVPRTARVQLASREQAKFLHLAARGSAARKLMPNVLLKSRIDWLYAYDPTSVSSTVQ